MPSQHKPADKRATTWLYALGYLASIGLALAALFVGIPLLLARAPTPLLGWLAVILFVPAVPAASVILQGEAAPRLDLVLIMYVEELADLVFQLLALLIILPLVGVNLIVTLGGLFLAALAIGGVMYALQTITSTDLGIAIGPAEMTSYLRVLLPGLVVEGLLVAFMLWLNPRNERIMAWFGEQRHVISQRIKRHYPRRSQANVPSKEDDD